MPELDSTWEALEAGVMLPTSTRNTLLVERNRAEVIEIDERQFMPQGHVLLPLGHPPGEDDEAAISGLSVLAHALCYAAEQKDRVLLVAGHADAPSGHDDKKAAQAAAHSLSARRAQNVHALLKADRAAFAETCQGCDQASLQLLLTWAHTVHEIDCDPGPLDGVNNAPTRAALLRFRAARAPDADATRPFPIAEDWEAFFDLYQVSLAHLLEVEPSAMAQKHQSVKFHAPEAIGCGDRWPLPVGNDAAHLRSRSKRRVDLVFFEAAKPIPKIAGISPAGAQLYCDNLRARKQVLPAQVPDTVTCIRMTGMFFDTNKCFLLPSAMAGIRKLVRVYEAHPKGEILIAGHTDTTGEPAVNDPLSLERAQAVVAYLTDDADAWLEHYSASKPARKRWGEREDLAMLSQLPGTASCFDTPDPLAAYRSQQAVGDDLEAMRRDLVTRYMALDGTSLPPGLTPVAHGCGENFPSVRSGDGVDEAKNRRVELFVFRQGVKPPPSGTTSSPGSREYPRWRQAVVHHVPLDSSAATLTLQVVTREAVPMARAVVEISQFGRLVTSTTTDARGLARVTGHDPSFACEVAVQGFACLAEQGAAAPGAEDLPAASASTPDEGETGCELSDEHLVEPEPPDLGDDDVLFSE